ncbi:polyprenyl synthetase family protein [Vagococcus coleopterorum]|uniref:Polyprenyl synthetase family protein n=1 Tax=Vagococcus coleopterorum TaxID=2714946 RepID=A0A6G8ALN4_9ENTE|nr:polyprenyl synthetase family protein [Vagococcus coleopterorum]QIL45981.1 polyprenyl synthetase family protein [Vagococcus coleopterorum]
MKIHDLWKHYPTLSKDLQKTLNLMEKSISISNQDVEDAIIEMISSGGKLLRPAYLILFSRFGKPDKKKITALAAAMESLHTATLVHDDIVDEAELRRSTPTLQHRFGKDVAVYAGDYLFVSSFKLLANYASSLKSIQYNAKSMDAILSGELGQMSKRYKTDVTVDDYLENISGKTAELFALSAFVGAYESDCSLLFSNKCKKIGHSIGMAFQIMDDILDYSQTSTTIGKPVLEDVKQGVYSLPLLYALQSNRSALLPLLNKRENMTDADAEKVYQIVQQEGAVDKAKKVAKDYTNNALAAIKTLEKVEPKTAKTLYDLTEYLLQRTQ